MWRHSQLARRLALPWGAFLAFGCCVLAYAESPGRSQWLTLKNGGKVVGKVVETKPKEVVGESTSPVPRSKANIDIVTSDEIRIRVASADVESSHVADRDSSVEKLAAYRDKASRCEDTLEGNWQIALWCKENRLVEQRNTHLRRILDFDANHREARRLLGFTFREGKWITVNQWRENDGLVLYKGHWRYPQDAALIKEREEAEAMHRAWRIKLNGLLREWDRTGSEAIQQEIESPTAAMSLSATFEANLIDASPRHRQMLQRRMMRMADAEVNQVAALRGLVAATLVESDQENLLDAIDHLRTHNPEIFDKQLLDGLRSDKNAVVNRAALLMSRLGRTTFIDPLIASLTTYHSTTVPTLWLRANFPNHPALEKGGRREFITISMPKQNEEVLAALIGLTGQDFGFNQDSWRNWYAQERWRIAEREKLPDLRRESL